MTNERTTTADWGDALRQLTPHITVLQGDANGAYPSGNSVVVQGSAETLIIDPSVTVAQKGGAHIGVDIVVTSHAHEDHLAGLSTFPEARACVHHDDLAALHTLDGLMAVYGLEGQAKTDFSATVVEEFFYSPRPDAEGFTDGHVFDLGGITAEAVHLPGHTRGHSGFRLPGGVFFCSDIDLTGFGPYYGDAWSDLEQFEESIVKMRQEDAEVFVTFHHKGIIEGREKFLSLLDTFHSVIGRRHQAMFEFLVEPRTIEDFVAHRFIYRPHVEHSFADSVERRSAQLHLQRMLRRGEAHEVEPGRYQRLGTTIA